MLGADARDAIARSLLATWTHVVTAAPGGWTLERDGALAAVSGAPLAMMNGVWVANPGCGPDVVSELLAAIAASGLPHCLQLRPPVPAELYAVAEGSGLSRHPEMPLMALEELDGIEHALGAGTLSLRRLEPSEAPLHCEVASAGFGLPAETIAVVGGPATLALPGVSAYVGEIDGVAVTTSLSIRIGREVGIFDVATLTEHRRRGYAAAATALAVREASAAGARTAWLQSSALGLGVYERLGFRLAESWHCWASVQA